MRDPVVGQGVDVEGESHVALGGVEDRLPPRDARVVDDDCRLADLGADLPGRRRDLLGRRYVAVEEVDLLGRRVRERLDVQHHDGDAALCQQLDDMAADPAGASCDGHDLPFPIVLVARPSCLTTFLEK